MNLHVYETLFDSFISSSPSEFNDDDEALIKDVSYPLINYLNTFNTLSSSGGDSYSLAFNPHESNIIRKNNKLIKILEHPIDIIIEWINTSSKYNSSGLTEDYPVIDVEMLDLIFAPPTLIEAPRDSRKPISVYVIYTSDLNILTIHKAVRAKYAINIQKEPVKYLKLWNEYCGKVRDCIEDYIFLSTQKIEDEDSETLCPESVKKYKLSLINKYILLTNKYITINSYSACKPTENCSDCGYNLKNRDGGTEETKQHNQLLLVDINGVSACPHCGKEYRESTKIPPPSSNENVKLEVNNNKIIYEDLTNFLKRIEAYEGKQKNPPPTAIIKQLSDYFDVENNRILLSGKTCQEIKELETNEEKKTYTNILIMEEALKKTKNTAYYKDIELLTNWVWGWKFQDISSVRDGIVEDYITAQQAYDEIKERESSLNINLRLIFHLMARGFKCELSDFKIVTSVESLNYHKRMFRGISELTGIPYKEFL